MPRKMDMLSQDIYDLVKQNQPLYWREIVERLYPKYEGKYKDKDVFESAVSNRLAKKTLGNLLVKMGDQYGTRKFEPSIQNEFSTEKTSKFGFFGWLKWKREYNDLQLDREIRELDSEFKTLLEQAQLNEDDSEFLKKCEEIEDKYKRKYGLA